VVTELWVLLALTLGVSVSVGWKGCLWQVRNSLIVAKASDPVGGV